MSKIIKPVVLNDKEILKVFKTIRQYLKDTFFNQIQNIYKDTFNSNLRLNEISTELQRAFKNNIITYKDNLITGTFNSRITRELKELGATYDFRRNAFKIDVLPSELQNIVYNNQFKVKNFVYDLDDFASEYLKNLEQSIDFIDVDYNGVIDDYFNQLQYNFEDIGIKPTLNKYQIKAINDKYIYDSKTYIKDFLEKDVIKLREQIKKYVLEDGYSDKTIANYIEKTYNTTQTHSLFIARQESSLILAQYTQSQYESLGIKKYVWLTSNDERVRDYPNNNKSGGNHKMLDKKVFSFNDPPITNLLTGERHNPGEAFNCRCVASAIID